VRNRRRRAGGEWCWRWRCTATACRSWCWRPCHEPFVDQRAASYHPPTIEMLDGLGLAEEIVPEGLKSPVYRFHDR
jgi:hypothetical protein